MKRRVGIIGTGEIARLHAEALEALGWEIAGGYDIIPEVLENFCRAYHCPAYGGAREILEDSSIDAVYICTRHDSHVQLGIEAIEKKKTVFMEKPAALSLAEAKRLIQAYRKTPVIFTVGYNMRVSPALQRFMNLLAGNGAEIKAFRASMTGPAFMRGWASDPQQGGGVLVCQGSHMFDLLQYVTGSPVEAVCAVTDHLDIGTGREPNAAAILVRMKSGVTGTLLMNDEGTAGFHAGMQGRMVNITVYTGKGTFDVDAYGKVRWGTEDGYWEELPCPDSDPVRRWGYMEQAKYFARQLDGESSCLCTLEQAVQVAAVVEAARISAKTASWQPVEMIEDQERKLS